MNKGLIFCLGMGLGAGLGVTGTYLYMNRLCDARIDGVVADFKANYRMSSRYPVVDEIEEVGEVNPVDDESGVGVVRSTKSSLGSEPVDIERVNYSDISRVYQKPSIESLEESSEDDGFLTAEDVLLQAEHPQDGDEEDVRLIDIGDYATDDEYEKSSLVWYTDDDILLDEDGYEIEDRGPIVGDVLDNIIDLAAEEGTIYVRNDISGVDYDIDVIEGSYKDNIEDGMEK